MQRKKWQLPSSLPCSSSAAWEAPALLDTTLTWGCQGHGSVTEVTSTDKQGHRRILRRNTVLAKGATREYHTSILAKNIGVYTYMGTCHQVSYKTSSAQPKAVVMLLPPWKQ